MDASGWAAVADTLESITSLTCLNDCFEYAAIRAGGLAVMNMYSTYELGGWVPFMAPFLERSAGSLTHLNVRCAIQPMLGPL